MTTWVLLAGLPATGKSTLARALESRIDAITLDKDRVRETLFPGKLTDYTREQDDLCMRAVLDAAAYLTERRCAPFILFDGRTFARREQIQVVLDAAERAGAAWKILHLTCPDQIAEARLRRADLDHPARNRDVTLYRKIQLSFEPIWLAKLDIDTTGGIKAAANAAHRYLAAAYP